MKSVWYFEHPGRWWYITYQVFHNGLILTKLQITCHQWNANCGSRSALSDIRAKSFVDSCLYGLQCECQAIEKR